MQGDGVKDGRSGRGLYSDQVLCRNVLCVGQGWEGKIKEGCWEEVAGPGVTAWALPSPSKPLSAFLQPGGVRKGLQAMSRILGFV